MAVKTKIHKGYFEAIFKAEINTSDKEKIYPNSIDFNSFDIELVGNKKFIIESIKTVNGINTEKYLGELTSVHTDVNNVETTYPKETSMKFNPINKNWSSLIINNPEIPAESISTEDNNVLYGIIKGEAFHFERIYTHEKVKHKNKVVVSSVRKKSVVKSEIIEEKPCFSRKDLFADDGYLSPTRPVFADNGCFSSGRNGSILYPQSNSCYGSSVGCFNARPFPCFASPCFGGCFPGCFGGCFSGCFQLPLLRFLINLLGLLGLLYLLFLLLVGNMNTERIITDNDPLSDDNVEIVEEDLEEDIIESPPVEDEIVDEKIIEPIEDTEHQILNVGEGNKVYLTVGDFDVQDKDIVNVYFNDVPIQLDYELVSTPQNIELSNLKINQLNTLRVEAVSNGDKGVCTPQVYACHICGGNSNCAPTMQLELKSNVEDKKFGEITFYIKEQDCLNALLENDNTFRESLIYSYFSIDNNIRVKEKIKYWAEKPTKYYGIENPDKNQIESSITSFFKNNKGLSYKVNSISREGEDLFVINLNQEFETKKNLKQTILIEFDADNLIIAEYSKK